MRRKLLAFVTLSLLPVLAAGYWLVDVSVAQTKAGILRTNLVTAEVIEADISGSIAATKRMLSTTAERLPGPGGDGELANDLLQETLAAYPELLNIMAADRQGRVFASALWDGDQTLYVSDDSYFRHVMLSGWPTVSQTRLTSRSTGFPTAVVAAPIKDQSGKPTGVIAGELSLQHLQTRLAAMSTLDRGNIVLVDSDGAILTHPNWTYVAEGIKLSDSRAVRSALQGEHGTLEVDGGQDGERSLVAYVPVIGTSWVLIVGQPVSTAYAAVWSTMLAGLLVLILGVCAAAVLAYILLRWISRPFDVLCARVRGADGGLRHEEVSPNDELQQLAGAFDSLAAMLDTKTAQLADFKAEIARRNVQLKRLSGKIAAAEADQRKKIAIDIHDTVAQLLSTAVLEAQAAEQCLASDLDTAQQKIHSSLLLMKEISSEVRCNLFELHPQPSQLRGKLVSGLRDYLARYSLVSRLPCEFEVKGAVVDLEPAVEAVLFRVVQESLHNIKRHAQASAVFCCLSFEPTVVRLVVRDNGRGFSTAGGADSPGHLGLVGMEERAQSVGGSVTIVSEPGQGSVVTLEIPRLLDHGQLNAFSVGAPAASTPASTALGNV